MKYLLIINPVDLTDTSAYSNRNSSELQKIVRKEIKSSCEATKEELKEFIRNVFAEHQEKNKEFIKNAILEAHSSNRE